ncbi:hypothetical protein RND71_018853 [Anisodus tanguticus]|uniref:BRCT domain-containing protein n=1 Tax=Anisodus tanguticus TaxID=243964 RepID=A0AAE1S5K5_9SOLA|nr:hypothetical protein RND71_018853 [Anisodus tanguticus]
MEAEDAYTLPFYDTFNIESPTIGMENLDCAENENSHMENECEEEVVLDSDDERMHGTEVASVSKFRSSGDTRYTQQLDKWKLSPVSKRTYVGCLRRSKNLFKYMDSARSTTDFEKTNQQKQFSEINGRISPQVDNINASTKPRVKEDWCQDAEITKDEIFEGNVETESLTGYRVDGNKDFPLHSCNPESQIPEELAEANALDFVDHYLSVYDEDALNEVKAGGANKIVSPPIFSRGGPQRLASRMNVQNAVKNSGVFDWPDRQSESANGSFSRQRKNYGLKKQKVSSAQSSKVPMESMIRKLDEQFDMGAFEQQVETDENRPDVLDTYDVGFDTQMAAEAMETLLYAPPLKSDAVCAPRFPETSLVKEGEYPGRAFSREFNIDDSSSEPTECSSAEIELLRGKTRGFSSVVQRSASRMNVQNAVKNSGVFDCPERQSDSANGSFSRPRKILTYHRKNYRLEKQKVSSVQSSKEIMTDLNKAEPNFLGKLDEQLDMGAFEQQVENDGNRSEILDTYDVGLDTQMAAEAMETLLYAPPLESDAVYASLVKEGEYPERAFPREFNIDNNSSEPTECSSAEIELLRGKTKGFSSVVHRTRHQVSLNVRSLENLTTNPIIESNFPKKRRKQYELGELHENSLKVADVRGIVSKSGTNTSRKARKVSMQKQGEICQSVAGTLSQVKLENWSSKGKRTRISYSSICKYPVTSQKMMPMDFKRVESTESAKLNEMTSISTNLLTKDMESDVMSNGNSDPSYSLNDHKKGKQHMRSLSRSTLTQELFRLGYAEKFPDFLPRGSRRRKGTGDVRVLFSQSLDSKLIKQQQKILARLGLISTSNCSDATHFVTDSFVRTRNMLEAIACGKLIVTHLWLETCGRASCFVDEKSYILRDAKKEKELGISFSQNFITKTAKDERQSYVDKDELFHKGSFVPNCLYTG